MRRSSEREILAIHVLHRKERGAVHFADVVNAADVGMRDLARDAHFVVEASERVLVGGMAGRNFSATVWPSIRSLAR